MSYNASNNSAPSGRKLEIIVFGAGEVNFAADGVIDESKVKILKSESDRIAALRKKLEEFLDINGLSRQLFAWSGQKDANYESVLLKPKDFLFPTFLVPVTFLLGTNIVGRTDDSVGIPSSARSDSPFVTIKLSPRRVVLQGTAGQGPMSSTPWPALGKALAHEIFAHALPLLVRTRVTYAVTDMGQESDSKYITYEKTDLKGAGLPLKTADLDLGWRLDDASKNLLDTLISVADHR